jgi:uncharacterized integral membrane protein
MTPRRTTDDHAQLTVHRTRTSAVWVAIGVATLFLILLIIFIAQNNRSVPIHYLGASGHVSLAVALLIAAVAGAVVVLLASAARILQLRLTAHRHNRSVKRQAKADRDDVPASAGAAGSAPATQGETQPVETQR